MTKNEISAFNAGLLAVLDIAAAAARAIRSAPGCRMVRDEFAAEALAALAEEGRGLLLADPDADLVPASTAPDKPNIGSAAVMIKTTAAAE